jgi:CRISPR-associated protein Cas2
VNILVSYDVNTEDKAGRNRLRRVAIVCKNYGQRVQYSVFECTVNEMQFEKLRAELLKTIDKKVDNLRIYRLAGDRERCVESYGVDKYVDFTEPLII